MADEQTQAVTNEATQAVAANQANVQPPTQDAEDVNALPQWAQKAISELRKEAAAHRKAKSEAERAAQAQQEQAAKEQGKWKELYESVEPLAKEAKELREAFQEILEAELAAVPPKFKSTIPPIENPRTLLKWLRDAKAAGMFALPQPPTTDAASGAGDRTAVNAVAARSNELEFWDQLGLHNAVRTAKSRS